MADDAQTITLVDHQQRAIRLTVERRHHILEHPEMQGQLDRISETLLIPDLIVATTVDPSVHVYHRFYAATPVTRKYMLVVVKIVDDDAFVLTAFFSSRQKKGLVIWKT